MDFSEILIKHEEEIKKAIKKEYPHGQTIYFHYDDKITQNEVKEALENSKDHGGFLNALKDNIDEEMWEARDDLKNELGSFVAKWINENTDFEIDPEIPYSDLNDEEVDAFDDFLWENLEYDIDFETLRNNHKHKPGRICRRRLQGNDEIPVIQLLRRIKNKSRRLHGRRTGGSER